jgi:hypothetical protein
MPVYEYTALDAKGKAKSGIIDAEGASAARQKLRSSGIFPVSISETQEVVEERAPQALDLSRFFTRIKPAEIASYQPWTLYCRKPNLKVLNEYWPRSRIPLWKATASPRPCHNILTPFHLFM